MTRRIFTLAIVIPLAVYAQKRDQINTSTTPDLSKVLIYREYQKDYKNRGLQVYINDELITSLWNASFYTYEVKPGWKDFFFDTHPPVGCGKNMDGGKMYFIRVNFQEDSGRVRPQCQFVEEETVQQYFNQNKLRNVGSFNPKQDSIRRMKTRINVSGPDVFSLGIQLGGGVGFDTVHIFTLTDGTKATISAGGGFVLSVNGQYRFTSHISVRALAGFQVSTLVPTISNASATFRRWDLGISVRYGIPFAKSFRFDFGPGVVSNQGGELDIDASKIPGGAHNVFTYEPSVGFTFTTEAEYFFRSVSICAGMKYCGNTYSLKSSTSNGYTVPISLSNFDSVRKLDGSALYFYWGFNYFL